MAEYGKILPPNEPKEEVSTENMIAIILILIVAIKLILGGFGLAHLLILILIGILLITMIDSIRERGWVRFYDRNWRPPLITYYRNERPFMYWQAIIISWIAGPIFMVAFLILKF